MLVQIEILSECEIPGGWAFDAQLLDKDGTLHPITLRLSWADYNLWSPDGSDTPEKVAEAALGYLASQVGPSEIRPSLDAAIIRRLLPDADEKIPGFIRNPH